MLRLGVHAVAEEAGRRQVVVRARPCAGVWNSSRYPGTRPRSTAARQRALRWPCCTPGRRPPVPMEVVLGPGESGILLHEAVGHGLEADFNRKRTSNYTDQIGKPVASPLCTVIDDATVGHARGSINVDDEGNPGQRNLLIEKRHPAQLPAGPHFGAPLSQRGHGQRPAREFSLPSHCRA